MNFPESSIENLRYLGYTQDEARFLYLAATHSGYFSARQYLTFTGVKSGERNMAFTKKLVGKGHAAVRLLLRNGRVYHLFSRLVYRAIGREHLRNRREHSVEHMRTKLAILDFVLAHLDYRYLETEDEKVNYFCKELGLAEFLLPAKHYAGAIRERTTARYFVDKFPMFFSPESSSPPVLTFSFVDPGLQSLASFDTHLFAYGSLFSALLEVQFVYIATRPTHFEAARELFQVMAPRVTNPDPGVEGLRYFTYRHWWESKQYEKLDTEKIEFLNEATKRYTDPRIEGLYRPWLLGQIPVNAVTEEFRRLAPRRNVSFRTELVDGQAALFEPNAVNAKHRKDTSQVTEGLSATFSLGFQARFTPHPRETQEE
ncbi:MAG TPA: hypothetical protein VL128_12535 [Candidatus Eisenbacteria bacterium]|nr:hypothetical protein [Candidatus Eisenbacteria bacterium]